MKTSTSDRPSLRIEPDAAELLRRMAQAEHRSLASMASEAIRRAWVAQNQKGGR